MLRTAASKMEELFRRHHLPVLSREVMDELKVDADREDPWAYDEEEETHDSADDAPKLPLYMQDADVGKWVSLGVKFAGAGLMQPVGLALRHLFAP